MCRGVTSSMKGGFMKKSKTKKVQKLANGSIIARTLFKTSFKNRAYRRALGEKK